MGHPEWVGREQEMVRASPIPFIAQSDEWGPEGFAWGDRLARGLDAHLGRDTTAPKMWHPDRDAPPEISAYSARHSGGAGEESYSRPLTRS
jgi:hypothetical protein